MTDSNNTTLFNGINASYAVNGHEVLGALVDAINELKGVTGYLSDKPYKAGDVVVFNNKFYRAKRANIGKNPESNPDDWEEYDPDAGDKTTVLDIKNLFMILFANAGTILDEEGNIKQGAGNVGSSVQSIYLSDGKLTASSGNIGSGIEPVYLKDGELTKSTETVGSSTKPVYLDSGAIKESAENVGSATNPVYMKNGELTACNEEVVGSGKKLIYFGEEGFAESTENIGSDTKPIYLKNGEVTASTSTVGSKIKPVYMNSGTVTASDANVGTSQKPVYMKDGVITECSALNVVSNLTSGTYLFKGSVSGNTLTLTPITSTTEVIGKTKQS